MTEFIVDRRKWIEMNEWMNELKMIVFQIQIIESTWSNNMQISVLGGGVDTVSDHHPQVPGFKSRGFLFHHYPFQIQ